MSKPFIEAKANVSPLVIVREFGRDIPVECDRCGRAWSLRLYSDTILEQAECDELLTQYLLEHGWAVGVDHIGADREWCPQCVPAGDIVEAAGVNPENVPNGKGGP